ncbi:GNAT family N-acetyltransferase [Actinacidiphila soli]|uniref:GNAT family N-acetyltransferase n=1 Tax=Actinacidiphila soli TaxID=2487275 RepID=UPI001F0BC4EC|nr:GNAT family N-acetyltransferase [Actinacidiphila soli]
MERSAQSAASWNVLPLPVGDPVSAGLLRQYFEDIVSRYYGRRMTVAEIDDILAEFTSAELAPPTGLFLVGHYAGAPVGCVGLKALGPGMTELQRVFVHAAARGTGGGPALVRAAEQAAREVFGASVMRLDTRKDLVEARALYARLGYREIPAYHDDPFADHFFEKKLV